MFVKFKNILCHPSRIGMYILDRFSSVFGYFFFFFLMMTVLLATKDMLKPKFSGNTANLVADMVLSIDEANDTKYEDKKLTGTKVVIQGEGMLIYLNDSAHVNKNHGMQLVLVFGQSEANAYYANIHLGKISYYELSVSNFSFGNILSHNLSERLELETLINILLINADQNYRAIFFWNDFANIMLFYIITVLVCYVGASITNGTIIAKFRKKLVVYDSLAYFTCAWLSILYSASWVLYFGIFVAIVYTVVTFSHIKAIPIKKGENV